MKLVIGGIILFLALTGATTILMGAFDVDFGLANYWDVHGAFFLIFIALFPRLTLLFSSIPFGGFFWWLGLIFTPRLLVAVLATISYWNSNWILVIISWVLVLGGESSEKYYIIKKRREKKLVIGLDY